ncbi:hypothetical protein [Coleofasciculus chthonoplastes]|uniref:hypothetical protein n=1 Tax=Coleofasciculus chthonoplastes TaxID=64178 RepID=UPI0032F39D41
MISSILPDERAIAFTHDNFYLNRRTASRSSSVTPFTTRAHVCAPLPRTIHSISSAIAVGAW